MPYMPCAICQVPITSHAPCTIIWDQKIVGKENAKESIFTFSVYFWFCEDWTNKIIWGPRASQPPSSSQCCRPSPLRDNSGFAWSPCGFSSACAHPSTGCRSRSCTTNLHCTCPRNFLPCCYHCHGPWAEVMGNLLLKLNLIFKTLSPGTEPHPIEAVNGQRVSEGWEGSVETSHFQHVIISWPNLHRHLHDWPSLW